MTTDAKTNSITEVKNKIKQMRLEDTDAIKILYRYFDVYLKNDTEINVIIPFPEIKKDIYVQLVADPSMNIVMFKHTTTNEEF